MTTTPDTRATDLQYSNSEQVLVDLIARLEKATGPDRALDRMLCHELSPGTENFCNGMHQEIPSYTASIDAALTLVPDDTGIIIYQIIGKKPSVSLQRYEWDTHNNAHTTALALCIAALKARRSSTEERTTSTGTKVP